MSDPQVTDHLAKGPRNGVTVAAVGHDALDPDPLFGEEGDGIEQKRAAVGPPPIRQDLSKRQPGRSSIATWTTS